MKRFVMGQSLALLLMSWAAPAKTVDRIVAQVNDDIITLSDLNRELAEKRDELKTQFTGEQLEQEIKKAEQGALDYLIQEKLLIQKANELGFSANVDVQVSAYIQKIMADNKIKDTEDFERALSQQGMTLPAFRERIRRQIIINSLIQEFVGSRITLLATEIEKYYKDHAQDFSTPEEVSLSEIIIQIEGDASEAETKANEVHKRLSQGEPFATLASQFSKGISASKGGGIGSYVTAKLHPEIAKAIGPVKEGEITPVMKTKEGLVILRVDTRKTASVQPLEEVKKEIQERMWSQKFNPELKRFVAQLKEDAYIQIFTETK
jgi:peptidyl-prolyl cis-trans isomerase SurA